MRAPQRRRAEVLADFEGTRDQHRGHVSIAAPLLGMSKAALARALYRAKAAGVDVRFRDD